MKRSSVAVWALVAVLAMIISLPLAATAADDKKEPATGKDAATEAGLISTKERVSYAIGENLGQRMKTDGLDMDLEAFTLGVKDGLEGADSKLTDEQRKAAMDAFTKEMMAKRAAKAKAEAEQTKAEGAAFRTEYAKKEGAVTTASGLIYRVLKKGEGPSPKPDDTVTVHYQGTTIDGKEFDSSYKRNEPASFQVKGVIKGWQQVLQLMKVGDKIEVVIPPALGYGAQGAGPIIKPWSTLVFTIELLKIEPPKPAEAKPAEAKPADAKKDDGKKQD